MRHLPPAKLPVPKFATEEEEATYWETHSVAEIWDQLEPARPIKLPPEQTKAIRRRRERRKQAISLRLEPELIARAKKNRRP